MKKCTKQELGFPDGDLSNSKFYPINKYHKDQLDEYAGVFNCFDFQKMKESTGNEKVLLYGDFNAPNG